MTIYVSGLVKRLYVYQDKFYLRLHGISEKPKEEYFVLPLSHPNYNALFSMASMATMSRRPLQIGTVKDISPNEFTEVAYFVLDFNNDAANAGNSGGGTGGTGSSASDKPIHNK